MNKYLYIHIYIYVYRSRVEAAISLGLLPYVRQIRNMSREQLFICAMETREKQLLAQLLYKNNGNIVYIFE
jgi:hypothetical protein